MFDKEYRFKGSHAFKVEQLKNVFDSTSGAKLFDSSIAVYTVAPLIGFLYGEKKEEDNEKNPVNDQLYSEHIFIGELNRYKLELEYNFRLIMLLDEEYEPDKENRINKAFRHPGEDPNDIKLFDSYARGGIDVLYAKLINESVSPDDYVDNLFDFLLDFDDKFNKSLSTDEILSLCN